MAWDRLASIVNFSSSQTVHLHIMVLGMSQLRKKWEQEYIWQERCLHIDRIFWLEAGICKHLQWNLRIMDTLGTGLLSFVWRDGEVAPRPRCVLIASAPGFPVWVGPSSCKARVALLCCNGKLSMTMAIICINVWAIVDLSVLGGYFIYKCDHSVVSQWPLYRVER